jgi:hypothetical protein
MTTEARNLKPGMVMDCGAWTEWASPREWQGAVVAAVPVEVEPGLVEIRFVGGPPPLRLAADWPVTLDTPQMADFREAILIEEAERMSQTDAKVHHPCGPHRGPQGPNEDMSVCPTCWSPSYQLRPPGETYGRHLPDCSLPLRHESYCQPGGSGHPAAPVIRGYWPDVEAGRGNAMVVHPAGEATAATTFVRAIARQVPTWEVRIGSAGSVSFHDPDPETVRWVAVLTGELVDTRIVPRPGPLIRGLARGVEVRIEIQMPNLVDSVDVASMLDALRAMAVLPDGPQA